MGNGRRKSPSDHGVEIPVLILSGRRARASFLITVGAVYDRRPNSAGGHRPPLQSCEPSREREPLAILPIIARPCCSTGKGPQPNALLIHFEQIREPTDGTVRVF